MRVSVYSTYSLMIIMIMMIIIHIGPMIRWIAIHMCEPSVNFRYVLKTKNTHKKQRNDIVILNEENKDRSK